MRLTAAALILGALVLAAATAAAGSSTHRRGHRVAALSVRVLDTGQQSILRRGKVRVQLRVRKTSRVRVYVLIRGRGALASAVVITRSKAIKVKRGRWHTVSLRVVPAGRVVMSGCASGRTLQATALLLHGKHPVPGKRAQSRRRKLVIGCGPGKHHGGGGGPGKPARPIPYATTNADRCDIIDPAVCLQPFPNDYFTVADHATATGRRVNLNLLSMPANKAGKPIDPSDINRNDGFGPGSPIVTHVPGMDNHTAFAATGAVPITDLARTYDESQPVVVINTRTLTRQLIWSEIDANPKNPADVNLVIRPAVNLDEGTRYVVALRTMRDAAGQILAPSSAFRLYRDRVITTNPQVEKRRGHFENIFNTLAQAGINRDNLYLAWDFTVASRRSLSERQLAIRNDAYKQLGDTNLTDLKVQGHTPSFNVTKTTNYTLAQNAQIARQVEGTYTVPCYLNAPGCPSGSRFSYPVGSTTGPPTWIPGNTMTSKFTCIIPRTAMTQGGARPSLYGHGLFGSRGEVNQGQLQDMAQEHNFVFCATDWVGMACTDLPPTDPRSAQALFTDYILTGKVPPSPDCDVPTAIADESDLSNFPTLVDRVDQAFVNFMYLGRLLIHPQGFSADSAFQSSGHSVIDSSHLYYDGNSQGGIFGGSLIALEPDLTRGVVGVPGMNYSLLLQRSSDFGTGQAPKPDPTNPGSFIPQYAYPLYQSYPNERERQLILSLMQQMWDHSDPNGLAEHMTSDPLPGTPAHVVLMQGGLGDHQVSQFAAEVEARTIGARIHLPWADPGRDPQVGGMPFGLSAITSYPWDGSAYTLWDIGPKRSSPCPSGDNPCGTPPPPTTNTPPGTGEDPHEFPRRSPLAREQKSAFLKPNGAVINVCGNRPCYAGAWTGP